MIEDETAMLGRVALVIDYAKKGEVFREDAQVYRRFAATVWRGCVRSV